MRNAFAKRVVALSQCAADTGAGIVGCLRCKQGISIRKVVSAWKFFLVSFKHRMLVFSDLVPPFPFAEQINEKSINQKTAWCLNYVNVAIAYGMHFQWLSNFSENVLIYLYHLLYKN
mgnify:CR=1 FL=1